MKTTKRLISIVLLLTLLVGMVPTTAQAEEVQTSVDNGSTTIEGTNGFGTLLSEDIQEQQDVQEETHAGGYNIIDLTIEDGVAVVEYDTLEEANLVVSLYTEDGLQLLVSGNQLVQPEETEAVITLEGEIPEYFMASAYLLDTYDYSPLCASYSTPMYTKEMQDLLASTTDDYDADKVLNLDNDKTTNFAVYADTTKVIEYTEGVNTVITANDETATYVIGNADANITGLQTGDVLAYAYGEDQILIVKVASVNLNGTTATITGTDLEMEEVFSHVKLENVSDASDVVVDESSIGEGVTFDGLTQEGARTYALRDIQGDGSVKNSLNYTVDQKIEETHDEVTVSVSLKGTLGMELNIEFSYYVTLTRQFMKFETDVGVKMAVSLSGEVEVAIPLGDISVMFFGVSIGFEPSFNIEVEGKVEISCFVGFTIGYIYDSQIGLLYRDTTPKVEFDSKIEASIFLGIDLNPKIDVLKGALAKAELNAPIGLELKAELSDDSTEDSAIDSETIHGCENCVEMELNFKIELSAKISFLKIEDLTLKTKVKAVEAQIATFYWSLDHSEFGVGDCPYKKYRVTVQVKDGEEKAVSNINVDAALAESDQRTYLGKTNKNGIVVHYLQAGTYTFMATVDGEELAKDVTVEEACKVTLDKDSTGGKPSFISKIDKGSITDYGTVIASGECGANGDNVSWLMYSGGLLKICGNGEIKGQYYRTKYPWNAYREEIVVIEIEDGVTSIPSEAFWDCINMIRLDLPDSIKNIGAHAFRDCESLQEVTIPNSVKYVGTYAFAGCSSLSCVTILTENAEYGWYAFFWDENISEVHIKDIEHWCSNSFGGASGNPVEKARKLYLNGELVRELTIPNNVTSIGDAAFLNCASITSVILGENMTSIGEGAFGGCENLSSIAIPAKITNIGEGAFDACYRLSDVYYEGSEVQWNEISVEKYNKYLINANIHFNNLIIKQVGLVRNVTNTVRNQEGMIQQLSPNVSAQASIYNTSSTLIADVYAQKTVSISNLVPGEQYVLLALASIEEENILAPNNLLYIDQDIATEDGTLVFTYVQREVTDVSYVIACGASNKNLEDAQITFPTMIANSDVQTVNPTVVYDGVTLTEGADYVLVGTVSFVTPGTYTCYIRGVYDYTGTVECSYTVIDGNGWVEENGCWYYYRDGVKVTGWLMTGGKWYYFDGNGIMQTGWVQDGGVWYYLKTSGAMATGWQQVGSTWYYLNSSGAMVTGWLQLGSTWYYLDSSGAMVTGTVFADGALCKFNTSGVWQGYVSGWYQLGSSWYYTGSKGKPATGWQKIGGTWYYFAASGAMQTGWLHSGNTWYYLKSSGAMATGWQQVGGVWYYFNTSGAMQTGWVFTSGKWYYMKSSGAMATGWVSESGTWYYCDDTGCMIANTSRVINGKTYYFNANGACTNP